MFDSQDTTPAAELQRRIARFSSALAADGLDGALIVQTTDLFYFAGTIQQAHLYIPVDGEPLLMVRKDLARARAESALSRIVALDSPRRLPAALREAGCRPPRTLGLECDVLPANHYFMYAEIFEKACLRDISSIIRHQRAVKSPYEIAVMQEAARLSDALAASVAEHLVEGIAEIELAGRIEFEARRRGHQGLVRMRLWGSEIFYGHLMAGPSAAIPSYMASPTGGAAVGPAVAQGPGFRPIRRNEPVLVDYVFAYRGYLSDHARIFSLGPLGDDLTAAHGAMLDVQERIMAAARPGVSGGALYRLAADRVRELGYYENFMGVGPRRVRFVGHGIGLELDEYPFLSQGQSLRLETGMTVALEPKLVFPGIGVVGIENTHVVTADGLSRLGHFDDRITVL